MESKNRERFVRLANSRVNNAIKVIRSIGKLSNKSSYGYNNSDLDLIFRALTGEMQECKGKFDASLSKETKKFKLEY